MRRPVLCLISAALLGAGQAAPVHPVTVTIGGERLVDPYGWMAQGGADYLDWVHARDTVTRRTLHALPGYGALAAEVAAASDAETHVSDVEPVGDQVYYEKQGHSDAQADLYRRAIGGGKEQRLVDPVAMGGTTTSIHEYAVSPDNRRLAICLASDGSEEAVLRIMDLGTGRMLPERIDRARAAGPVWSEDGAFVFYNRLKATSDVPSDRFRDQTIYRHRPGDDPGRDVPIFTAADAASEIGRSAFIGILLAPGSAYALAFANSGVSKDAEWFVAPAADLRGRPRWRRVARLSDRIVLSLDGGDSDVEPVIRGSQAWFASLRGAPRGAVVRLDLARGGARSSTVAVPQQAGRLTGLAGTADGLVLAYASGSGSMLARAAFAGGVPVGVPVPYEATIEGLRADPRQRQAVVGLESWARQPTFFVTAAGGVRDLGLAPPFALDLADLVTETVFATARDGVRIPISVTHRRDLKRDGSAPTWAEAYGAYGFSYDPVFHPELVPFLRRGGVWAVAHVRGGGEFGESWHLAGKDANKPNSWRDFIASVEALEADGYCSRRTVVGFGASAGGIMIGRTVTERPDLLAGAVMWAPMSNMLRFENTEGGPANVAEFGSVTTPTGYAALRAMDTYSHVEAGTDYPAVLISIGLNDHRVPSWMGAELAARLQADSRSGRPVLLRVDDRGGHHVLGVSKADMDQQITDTLAFVLEQAGAPALRSPGAGPHLP